MARRVEQPVPRSPVWRRMSMVSGMLIIVFASVVPAFAQLKSEQDPQVEKQEWQNRYRSLLDRADELRQTIETERELYADANRRNYRRGPVRHVHQEAMKSASDELEKVEEELAGIQDEARRAGALPGWFYEVEAERSDRAATPELDAEDRGGKDQTDREGRNPLYLEDAADP